MGGAAGYRACLDHPDRFSGFLAPATAPPWLSVWTAPTSFPRIWHLYALSSPAGRHLARDPDFVAARLRSWRHRGDFTSTEIDVYTRMIASTHGSAATYRYYRRLVYREVPALFLGHSRRRLSVPTLQLDGADDRLTPRLPDRYLRHAEDMTMRTVPDCGHFIAEEQPTALLAAIDALPG
jgi:pimeloyl-ACP methyl ester carboxylesterase